jgi:hypothetical protein
MGSLVDIEMCLLKEALRVVFDYVLILFLATFRASFFLNIHLRELAGHTYHRSTLICG